MTPFSEKAIAIIQSIPAGKVATYGQIALLAGNPRNARRVSRLIHTCSKKYDLAWHRIVNIKGKISLTGEKYDLQYELLKQEGIKFNTDDSIDLKKYGF